MSAAPASEDLVSAFVRASRALVGVAARSLSDVGEEVTLPQFRTLVVLDLQGPQRPADLAEVLAVSPSTASRMVDRLVRKRLVDRLRSEDDRRMVRIELTAAGRRLVDQVTRRRRQEIETILEQLPQRGRRSVLAALEAFADAAGEAQDRDWALGWDT